MRPERRARRRTDLADWERLEARALMAFSTLGFSLPDLTVTGVAGRVAAWGGKIDVNATIVNIGTSTTTVPLAQAPGDTSTADAPASSVTVLIAPHRHSLAGAFPLGVFTAPPVQQNSLEQITQSFTLPTVPPSGFTSRPGGKFYVRLVANSNNRVIEANTSNNLSKPITVTLASQVLPALQATALNVPPVMQPGDTISPTIAVANLGTAPARRVQVALVASTNRSFNVGSSIVALYTINDIPPASQTPTGGSLATFDQLNLTAPSNVVTIFGSPVTLPTSPARYFLGVVVDPFGRLKQLKTPRNSFSLIHTVGPPIANLPPAGVLSTPLTNPFPEPPNGQLIGVVSSSARSNISS
jgi:uncharacterized repeat protein (TIGR01451 family)